MDILEIFNVTENEFYAVSDEMKDEANKILMEADEIQKKLDENNDSDSDGGDDVISLSMHQVETIVRKIHFDNETSVRLPNELNNRNFVRDEYLQIMFCMLYKVVMEKKRKKQLELEIWQMQTEKENDGIDTDFDFER